jgi:hypothetical protein
LDKNIHEQLRSDQGGTKLIHHDDNKNGDLESALYFLEDRKYYGNCTGAYGGDRKTDIHH